MKGGVGGIFTDYLEPTFFSVISYFAQRFEYFFTHVISNDYRIFMNELMQLIQM